MTSYKGKEMIGLNKTEPIRYDLKKYMWKKGHKKSLL